MPCDLSGSNLLSFGSESEKSFLYSSVYTALTLSIIIILIILMMYPCSRKATAWQRMKTFLYIAAATFFVLVVHKGTITKVLQGKQQNASSERLIQGMGGVNTVADTVVVQPSPMVNDMQQFVV